MDDLFGLVDSGSSRRHFTHQNPPSNHVAPPRIPPREPPPPPPPSNESKPKFGSISQSSLTSHRDVHPNFGRPPPPPPPPSFGTSVSNGHSSRSGTANGAPAPPPPPPRGAAPTSHSAPVRRPSSDFVDHSGNGALMYDHHFESRFRFTPVEYLPTPDQWHPPAAHSKSTRQHLNVR